MADRLDTADVTPGGRSTTAADLLRLPLRRWPLPLAGALLGVAAGVAYLLLLPATYQATSVVAVRAVVTDPFSYPGPGADRVVNMTVENGLATGTDVITAIARATGQRPGTAKQGLTVEMPTGSQVLRFRYQAPAADQAITGANAAAAAYLATRQSLYQGQRDGLVKAYDAGMAKLAAERDKLRSALPTEVEAGQNTPPSVTAQLDRLRGLDDQLGQLTQRRVSAAAVDVTAGTVTQIAAAPAASDRAAGPVYGILALLAGTVAGAVAAYAAEAAGRRVRTAADVTATVGFPVLAELRGRGRRSADLRYLALATLGQLGPVPHRRVVLISATATDDVPEVATGLALALAEQGNTVRWEDLSPQAPASRTRMLAAADPAPPMALPLVETDEPAAQPRNAVVLVEDRVPAVGPGGVRIGGGTLWLDPPDDPPDTMVTVVRAAPAERDDHGVRAALEAAAVLLVRRDRTRIADLERLAATFRLTGVRVLGAVVVSSRD